MSSTRLSSPRASSAFWLPRTPQDHAIGRRGAGHDRETPRVYVLSCGGVDHESPAHSRCWVSDHRPANIPCVEGDVRIGSLCEDLHWDRSSPSIATGLPEAARRGRAGHRTNCATFERWSTSVQAKAAGGGALSGEHDMTRSDVTRRRPVLEPTDRISKIVFGLIMATTFTGSLSATAGREDIRTMLTRREKGENRPRTAQVGSVHRRSPCRVLGGSRRVSVIGGPAPGDRLPTSLRPQRSGTGPSIAPAQYASRAVSRAPW